MRTFTLFIMMLISSAITAQVINVPSETYPTIQSGIDSAQDGYTILVAEGTYQEQINFHGKAITVASHYFLDSNPAHITNTVIDGSNLTVGNGSVVLFTSGEDTTSVLNGFTIRNGKGTYDTIDTLNYLKGGGIVISNSGAKIMNNRITNNVLNAGSGNRITLGAGISALHPSTNNWVVVINNTIDSNQCISGTNYAGGAAMDICYNARVENNHIHHNQSVTNAGFSRAYGAVAGYSNLTIWYILRNNIIEYNTINGMFGAEGAGISFTGFHTVISGNKISFNEALSEMEANVIGGGIRITNPMHAVITDNEIVNNISQGTGGGLTIMDNDTTVIIERNTFKSNQAMKGGAISTNSTGFIHIINNVFNLNNANYSFGGAVYISKPGISETTASFVNNSFADNSATQSGGAVYSYGCNPQFLNNIFWHDTAATGAEITIDKGTGYIAYSNIDVTDIYGEMSVLEGIMLENPEFCTDQCLMPASWSKCLNMGTDMFIFQGTDTISAPLTDINGSTRPIENAFDLGAYERDYSGVGTNNIDQFNLSVYPNPFNNHIWCHYRLDKKSDIVITVFDIVGRAQSIYQKQQPAGLYNTPLELGMLQKGIYLIELRINDNAVAKKVIKQNK